MKKNLPGYIAEPDLYTYVIGQDYSRIGSVFNVQTILSEFLNRKNIKHDFNRKYGDLFDLMLKVQPKWLDLQPSYFSGLISGREHLKPKELKEYLKEKIKADFRCLKAIPKWLQSPEWPVHEGLPLTFAGQIDISGLSHDTAQLYVFFDDRSGKFFTISQSC